MYNKKSVNRLIKPKLRPDARLKSFSSARKIARPYITSGTICKS